MKLYTKNKKMNSRSSKIQKSFDFSSKFEKFHVGSELINSVKSVSERTPNYLNVSLELWLRILMDVWGTAESDPRTSAGKAKRRLTTFNSWEQVLSRGRVRANSQNQVSRSLWSCFYFKQMPQSLSQFNRTMKFSSPPVSFIFNGLESLDY